MKNKKNEKTVADKLFSLSVRNPKNSASNVNSEIEYLQNKLFRAASLGETSFIHLVEKDNYIVPQLIEKLKQWAVRYEVSDDDSNVLFIKIFWSQVKRAV